MKWYRSFRAKLILTLFPVVAAVTIASILAAERRFGRMQQEQFEEQFARQIRQFEEYRAERFDALSMSLQEVAAMPELIDGFRNERIPSMRPVIEPILENLAEQRLQAEQAFPGFTPPAASEQRPSTSRPSPNPSSSPPRPREGEGEPRPPPGDGKGKGKGDGKGKGFGSMGPRGSEELRRFFSFAPFIAFLRPDGSVIEAAGVMSRPQDPPGRTINSTSNRAEFRRETQRRSERFLRDHSEQLGDILKGQLVGYKLTDNGMRGRDRVREIFVTPVRDPEDDALLGAFIMGLPLPNFDEQILYEVSGEETTSEIMSGVWVEGTVVSNTIPEEHLPVVTEMISQDLNRSQEEERDLIIELDGVRHRLIYRVLNPESPLQYAAQVKLYSLAELDSEFVSLRTMAAEITGTALLLALGLILFVSRGLSGPVTAMTQVAREVGKGRLDQRVPVKTHDELGDLAKAFNEMTDGLALQEKYRSVLNAVADPSVAEQLLQDQTALGGEQREVTMLFCDIRGFTALSERLDATEVIDVLNEHMSALTQVAYEHGGTVDKFVGDLIMVLFGAPVSQPDDAVRAVRCGLAMQQKRRELNQTGSSPLEVGIGIASGSVVAGCMGSDQRMNYTVLGHRVNLASRLCDLAGAGQVVIDDQTRAQLPADAELESLQATRLKGVSEPVESFVVRALPHGIQTAAPATAGVGD